MTTRLPIKVNLDDALLTISIIPYFWQYAVLPDLTGDTASLGLVLRAVLTDERMALKLVQLMSLFPASDLLVIATALLRCASGVDELTAEMSEAMGLLETSLANLVAHALSADMAIEHVTLAQADGDSQADGFSEQRSAKADTLRDIQEHFSFGGKKSSNSMN